ncbi:MAG: SDR family NAD(P)-dependent oxidoreductase, partial [Gammaproteobacteria bacterium]|nr:SDR family NAD(P)-dependent oxidoreductase [Gammaproteobacteria bacterium]
MTENDGNSRLSGRVALVTGGARRVGAAIVRGLHSAGASVLVHYRASHAEAIALTRELNDLRPGSAQCLSGDLLDPDLPGSLIEAALERFGALDVLVNNASSFYPTPVGRITAAAWDDLLGTNLKAPLFLSQAAAPALRARRGSIVNIVDIHGLRPLRGHPVYSAAKAG